MNYNFSLVGLDGVGKSAFLWRMKTGKFLKDYTHEKYLTESIEFFSSYGNITFHVKEGCISQDSHGVFVFFDICDEESYQAAENYIKAAKLILGDAIPILLCGTKSDLCLDRKVPSNQIILHRKYNLLGYIDISSRSCYNFENPFLCMGRKLSGKDDLVFVDEV